MFQFVLIAATLMLAGIVQSAVGFGMGMVAIPVMVWVGVGLPQAIAITLAGSFLTSGAALLSLRRAIPWRHVGLAASLRMVGIVAGIFLLAWLAGLGTARVKQVVGVVLAAAVLMQWLGRVQPRERLGWGWTVPSFTLSGLMAGAIGMGGPPLVLWVMAHHWSADRTRAFLLGSFLATLPLQVVVLAYKFGVPILADVLVGMLCVPVILLGVGVGVRIGRRISRPLLQKLAFTLLLLLAVSSALSPWLPWRRGGEAPVATTPPSAKP